MKSNRKSHYNTFYMDNKSHQSASVSLMCYSTCKVMKLFSLLFLNLALGNNLHLILLRFFVGLECLCKELSLCLCRGVVLAPIERREGVSRQLRGK